MVSHHCAAFSLHENRNCCSSWILPPCRPAQVSHSPDLAEIGLPPLRCLLPGREPTDSGWMLKAASRGDAPSYKSPTSPPESRELTRPSDHPSPQQREREERAAADGGHRSAVVLVFSSDERRATSDERRATSPERRSAILSRRYRLLTRPGQHSAGGSSSDSRPCAKSAHGVVPAPGVLPPGECRGSSAVCGLTLSAPMVATAWLIVAHEVMADGQKETAGREGRLPRGCGVGTARSLLG
jgi:hypothetical protein